MPVTYDDLRACWARLGLAAGQTALVHSSLRAIGHVDGGPRVVVESFTDLITPQGGTVLFPAFNFDFCRTGEFDADTTPSQMGAISERARLMAGPLGRTFHPIYSFSVFGPPHHLETLLLRSLHPSAYGQGSVFGWLTEQNAWIVMIGLPWNNSFTYVHHVEEVLGCTYRYQKDFPGRAARGYHTIGRVRQRIVDEGTWTMFVRDREHGVLTAVDPMGAELEARGWAQVDQVGNAKVVAVRTEDAWEHIRQILATGTAEGRLFTRVPGVAP